MSSALALPRVLVRRGAGSFAPSSSSAGFAAGLVLVPAACLVPVFAAAVFAAVDFVAVDFRERVRVLAGRAPSASSVVAGAAAASSCAAEVSPNRQ